LRVIWLMLTLVAVNFVDGGNGAAAFEPITPDGLCSIREANDLIVMQAIEAECMQRYPGKAERSGDRLIIPLANGQSKEFVSNSAACNDESGKVADCKLFTFLGHIPELNSVVIEEGCYEFCHDNFLVSVIDGDVIKFEDPPHLSPRRDRLIVVAADPVSGLTMPDIQLFDIRSGKLVRIFDYSSAGLEAWSFRDWNEDGVIELEVDLLRGMDCPNVPQAVGMKLQNTAEGWRLTPRPSCH
jgi:hypothetical protein